MNSLSADPTLAQASRMFEATRRAYEEAVRLREAAAAEFRLIDQEVEKVGAMLEDSRRLRTYVLIEQSRELLERCNRSMHQAIRTHTEVLEHRRRNNCD